MNGNIIKPQLSTEKPPASPTPDTLHHTPKAIDLYIVENNCFVIGVEPTDDNLRRMRRAIDLHQAGAVHPFNSESKPDAYYVRSQSEQKFYVVMPHSGCDCPDAKRLNGDETYSSAWERINQTDRRCKHEMTVALFKEQEADQAAVIDAQADRHAQAEANRFDNQWDDRHPCQ